MHSVQVGCSEYRIETLKASMCMMLCGENLGLRSGSGSNPLSRVGKLLVEFMLAISS